MPVLCAKGVLSRSHSRASDGHRMDLNIQVILYMWGQPKSPEGFLSPVCHVAGACAGGPWLYLSPAWLHICLSDGWWQPWDLGLIQAGPAQENAVLLFTGADRSWQETVFTLGARRDYLQSWELG